MQARDEIDGILAELGGRLDLGLRLDATGTCAMLYGDGKPLDLWVPENGSVLVMYAALCDIPTTGREAFFASLLALGLHGIETDGCILGIDEAADKVMLSINRPVAGLDAVGLENVLGNFIEIAERMRSRLAKLLDAASSRPAPAFADTELWKNLHLRA